MEPAEVDAFARECARLLEDVESFAAAVSIRRDALALRLDNLRTAAAKAKASGCGVYVG